MSEQTFDLVAHITRQRAFSEKTFGPGTRQKVVCDHIRKELIEIEAAKQTKNEARLWPDWRTQPIDRAIEHIR